MKECCYLSNYKSPQLVLLDQGDTPESAAVPDFDCCWMVELDKYHLHPVVNHQSMTAADAVAAVVNSWCLVEKY